jgi:hypothetical protein
MSSLKKEFYALIIEAQKNDCESNYSEAFVQYLQGINALSHYLKTEAINKSQTIGTSSISPQLVSGVNTLKNCIERLQVISNYSLNNNNNKSESNEQKVSELTQQPISESVIRLNKSQTNSNTIYKSIDIRNSGFCPLSPVPNSSSLEKAYKENAFLTKIFEHRFRTTTDPSKKASLQLELERRLNENIQLAKARDEEKYHEMYLRERKALEDAAKKLSQQQNLLNLDNESMIVDNTSQQQLYAQILQYESINLTLTQEFRCPNLTPDIRVVNEIISKILYNAEHPLAKWVRKFQHRIIYIIDPLLKQYLKQRSIREENNLLNDSREELIQSSNHEISFDLFQEMEINISQLESEALERHFNNITTDISLSHETITLMLTLIMFDNQLYYSPSNSDLLRDQHFSLHTIIADYLYPPIWSSLQNLFRIVYHKQEEELKKGMQELFLFNDLQTDLINNFDTKAIEETAFSLKSIIPLQSPYSKLKAMVRLTQRLCNLLKSNSSNSSEISADELVPALCHVALKCSSPQLISECYAIEQLVDQKYLLGEEGYCLSSIMTALKYIQMNSHNILKDENND